MFPKTRNSTINERHQLFLHDCLHDLLVQRQHVDRSVVLRILGFRDSFGIHASGNSLRNSDLFTISSNSTATTSKVSIMVRFVTFSTSSQFISVVNRAPHVEAHRFMTPSSPMLK
uniref:(northern house mosquito) hypothetical protein n=1 Tax=Culex pipiens TaxID=7175 RepID=A0A8D8AF07_CULPI